MTTLRINKKDVCWRQMRGGDRNAEILENGILNPDFYGEESPGKRPCFWNAHSSAWKWHPVYGDPCSLLFLALMGELELFFVDDLSQPKGQKVGPKTIEKVLKSAIFKHMKPGTFHRQTDASSRSTEERLRGYKEWGYGRRDDGTPFVVEGNYVCHDTRSEFPRG